MGFLVVATVFLQALFLCCKSYPTGAPGTACSTLTPVHPGGHLQTSRPPYSVSAARSGDKVTVTISSPQGSTFEGFVMQARSSNDRNRIVNGTFTQTNRISRAMNCFNGRQNTLTQVNNTIKRIVETEWTPANGVDEEIIFRATIAQDYYTFWTEVESSPVRVRNVAGGNFGEKKGDKEPQSMYDDCSITKGCFGYPNECVPRRDCEIFLTYVNDADGISFAISGYLSGQTYMAVGLSNDNQMGGDSVTECIRQNRGVILQESWNNGRRNSPIRLVPEGMYRSSIIDGLVNCSWSRPYLTEVNGRKFDLQNSTHYLLIATGPVSDDGRVLQHVGRLSTKESVNLTAFDRIEGEGIATTVKIHGTFMVTAWVGLVSIAILLARHFKTAWETKTVFGVKVWFAFHRGLMILALLFVAVAFISIFIHKNGWDNSTENPHAILGCIAVALGLFQPIMAAFRPGPDHPRRPFFNWLHWAVGNSAQIIAVVTIFFAVTLDGSGLKESFYWVMAIFVIIHCIFHFLFQLHSWTTQKKKNNEVKMVDMNAGRGYSGAQNNTQDKNLSGNVFRVLLLGIYGIFLAVIMMALYALIGVA